MLINGVYIDKDTFFIIFFFGMVVLSIFNLTNSLCEYLLNKSWLVNDYERIIYYLSYDHNLDLSDFELCHSAIARYENKLNRKEKIKKFFSKFKIKR